MCTRDVQEISRFDSSDEKGTGVLEMYRTSRGLTRSNDKRGTDEMFMRS